jgi:hypothetical protein
VQDQPVVSVAAEGLRHNLLELRFDLVDGLARGEASAVANAEHVRVDCKGFLAESRVEDHVRSLAADAGQGLKLLAGSRHLAAMLVDQCLGEGDDVLGLRVEQADRLDRFAKPFLAEIDHLLRPLDVLEQRLRRDIHADVGRLRGQHDGDEQLVGIGRFELGRGRGVRLSKPAEEFENLIAVHKAPITSRIE